MKISLLGGAAKTALDGTELIPSEKGDGTGNEHFSTGALKRFMDSPVVTDATAARIAAATDANSYILFTNAGAVAFSLPADADADIPVDSVIEFEQGGAGVVTVTAGAGATINSRGGLHATAGQHAVCAAKKVAPNTYTLMGDLA